MRRSARRRRTSVARQGAITTGRYRGGIDTGSYCIRFVESAVAVQPGLFPYMSSAPIACVKAASCAPTLRSLASSARAWLGRG